MPLTPTALTTHEIAAKLVVYWLVSGAFRNALRDQEDHRGAQPARPLGPKLQGNGKCKVTGKRRVALRLVATVGTQVGGINAVSLAIP